MASRKVMASKIAITLESCHAVEALQEVLRDIASTVVGGLAFIGAFNKIYDQ